MMKIYNYKHFSFIHLASKTILLAMLALAVYALAAYAYTRLHMRPITPLVPPSPLTAQTDWRPGAFSYIHQVNQRQRMLRKSQRYNGFEIDTYTLPNDPTIYVAHDPRQFKYKMTLQAAFSIPQDPQKAFFWIDMKTSLTQAQIDEVKKIAAFCGVPLENLIFEPPYKDPAQAKLLSQNGLHVILFITGFYKENLSPEQTQALVDKINQQIEEIHPLALASGMGNYPYLKAYFPQYYKAICYNTTKRPSLKKHFMRRLMRQDPHVIMYLTDEYSWDNWGFKHD